MEIKEILQEKPWEEFLLQQPHTPFLQSWAWGEFQEKLGFSHHRLSLYKRETLAGVCLALVGRRKLGSFVYVPHGPVLSRLNRDQAREALEYLKEFAGKERVDYLRVEPSWVSQGEPTEEIAGLLVESGLREARSATSQAGGTTLLLDLELPEEELLAGMRKTTRYLVRKATGMGVEIESTSDPRMMDNFHRLMGTTRRRQRFVPQSQRYLQLQFETLAPRQVAKLSLARYQGDILAAAIIVSYGDTVSYLHAASVRSEVPASHLLVWESIREAKKKGFRYFDFWGVAPTSDPRHPWYGYSLFKRGFGGYRVDYVGTWDHPLSPRYLAVSAVENARRLIRRT